MSELQTRTLIPSEHQSQDSDDNFEIVVDLSETVSPMLARPRASVPLIVWGALADLTMAISTVTVFCSVVDERSSASSSEMDEPFLAAPQVQFLRQVEEDIAQLPLRVRSSNSAKLCLKFATNVGIALASARAVRWAVFGDEEDGITLVAHSRLTKRQVSFEFEAKTQIISIVSIDEQMRRFERACRIENERTLGNAVAWLYPY